MNATRFTNCLGMAFLVLVSACAPLKTRNPLEASQGWRLLRGQNPHDLDPAIVKDYREYIQQLPQRARIQITESSIHLFENANGQHAVSFDIARPPFMGVAETIWTQVLVYDQRNKRIKVIQFKSGKSLML